jgi:transcriptional regulator with XRE-family HTH domain
MNPPAKAKKKDKDPELVEFGSRMKSFRLKAGLTQESLADSSGMHWSFVGQVERGERNVTYKSILKLAHGLGISASSLMPPK